MERLERNTDKFYAVCSGEDVDLLDDVAAIENAIAKFDYQLADSILGNVRENIGDTPEFFYIKVVLKYIPIQSMK